MKDNLENILRLVQDNPVEFSRFSGDVQQIDPELRVVSILNILDNIDLPRNSTIVDIGTGYGYGAVLLNALGYNVFGLDINGDKLREGMDYWDKLGVDFDVAKDVSSEVNTSGKLYFLEKDARSLDEFPDKSVDMVTAFYISGYMVGRNGAFREVGRILKSSGDLVATTEGPLKIPSFLREPIVRAASRLVVPRGLKFASIKTIKDSRVYDKFVIAYDKKL